MGNLLSVFNQRYVSFIIFSFSLFHFSIEAGVGNGPAALFRHPGTVIADVKGRIDKVRQLVACENGRNKQAAQNFMQVQRSLDGKNQHCERQCVKDTLCDIKHELKELNKKQSCTKIIIAKDIGTTGYVINDPGYYCLGEDVNFASTSPFTPAIQVLANDVTIDLEGHTLKQVNQGAVPYVYGVIIGQNPFLVESPDFVLNNVTVTNGTIENFSGNGIFSYNSTFDDPSFAQIPFTNLFFTSLNVLGCGAADATAAQGGILLLASGVPIIFTGNQLPVAFGNILIDCCNINNCLGNAAILIQTGDSVVIQDTQANDLFCSNGGGINCFAYLLAGSNIQMIRCQGNRTTSYDPTGALQVGGVAIGESVNVYVKDSQFNAAYGETDEIVNNNLSLNNNAVFENCQFNNNQGGASVGSVLGVHASSGLTYPLEGQGIRFIKCQFNGATVDPTNTRISTLGGFFCTCERDMDFEDCQARNIATTGPTAYVAGYWVALVDNDAPDPKFTDCSNLSFRRCIASDIQGTGQVTGFQVAGVNINVINGTQIIHKNTVLEDCIAEHIFSASDNAAVAGIAHNLNDWAAYEGIQGYMYPQQINFFVRGCRVSDVGSTSATPNPLSAGILAQSIQNPVIINNSVSYCDRGILLTGTTAITPNGFELAATFADALAQPPVYLPITTFLEVSTDQAGVGPFEAFYTANGPRLTAPISAQGAVTVPADACTTVTNDLTGKIGIVLRDGLCSSHVFVLNAEAAGDIATIIVDDGAGPQTYAGSPAQQNVAVVLYQADGDQLVTTVDNNPATIITIDSVPIAGPQTFVNITRGNSVTIYPSQVANSFVLPTEDLTELGWQPGDQIQYFNNGNPDIPGLVNGTIYYAIVYIPGFSTRGVIQNNEVDNCTISGYQDDSPATTSAWLNNAAVLNANNYAITWLVGPAPIDTGSINGPYPTPGSKYYNLSLNA